MGGLDSLSGLLWSPIYAGLLLFVVATTGLLLRALAPVGFRRVGTWKAITGTAGVLVWVFALAAFTGGAESLQAFFVAAYFAVIGAALIFLPAAVALAQVGRYRFAWFVVLAIAGVLVVTLLAELVIGPEPVNGWSRWLSSLVPLAGLVGGGALAFAVGARVSR